MKCQFKSLKGTNYTISLDHPLGKGSYGSVYVAFDKMNNRYLAAKQVDLSNVDETHQKQITNEIVNMRKINNPHVARLFDVFQGSKHLYLFIEYCNGGSLDEYIQQKGGRLSESEAISFMKQLLEGYNSLYKCNIVHRDIKPANVILHDGRAKLTDFGFSKAVDDLKVANFQTRVGTPLYMSPQILEGAEYSNKTDVWSFGVLFYKILYGQEPWSASSEALLMKKISETDVSFPEKPPVTQMTKNLIQEMLKFNEDQRIGFEKLFSRIDYKLTTNESVLGQSSTSLKVDKLIDVYTAMKINIEGSTVIRNPYEGLSQTDSIDEIEMLVPMGDLEKKDSMYHNDEQMRMVFQKQRKDKEIGKIISSIGFFIVSKLNKMSLIANLITLFYEINTELKIVDSKQAYKFLFILVKYYMISAHKLKKWLSVTTEEFKQKCVDKDNKLAEKFGPNLLLYLESPVKKNLDSFLEKNIEVGGLFFNKIIELFEPQFKNLSPEEKKKKEVSQLLMICKRDFKKSEIFKELKTNLLEQSFKVFTSFATQLHLSEEPRDFYILIYHVWVLCDLKRNLKVESVEKLDFNKYYDFLNTAVVKKIAERHLPW